MEEFPRELLAQFTNDAKRATLLTDCYDVLTLETRHVDVANELCIKSNLFTRDSFRRLYNSNHRRFQFSCNNIQRDGFRLSLHQGHYYVPLGQISYILNNWNKFVGLNLQIYPTACRYQNNVISVIYTPSNPVELYTPRPRPVDFPTLARVNRMAFFPPRDV